MIDWNVLWNSFGRLMIQKFELNLLAYRSGGGGGGLHRNLAFVGSWVRIPLLWPLKRCQMTVPAQQLRPVP